MRRGSRQNPRFRHVFRFATPDSSLMAVLGSVITGYLVLQLAAGCVMSQALERAYEGYLLRACLFRGTDRQ